MKKLFFAITLVIISYQSFSQQELRVSQLYSALTQYNYFVGQSAQDFKTTPKAFGSGLADFSTMTGDGVWILNPSNRPIGLSAGLAFKITKFRFEKPWLFNSCPLTYDTNPDHTYNPFFFSRQGSKLVMTTLSTPLTVVLPVAQWFGGKITDFSLVGSVAYDRYIWAYQKLFYSDNGEKQSIKYPNSVLKNMPFRKDNIILSGGVIIKRIYLKADYQYFSMLTQGYDLHYVTLGISVILTKDWFENLTDGEGNELLPTFQTKL